MIVTGASALPRIMSSSNSRGAGAEHVAGRSMHDATVAVTWTVVLSWHHACCTGHHHRGHLRRLRGMNDQPGHENQAQDDREERPQPRSHVISISRAAPQW